MPVPAAVRINALRAIEAMGMEPEELSALVPFFLPFQCSAPVASNS
jgi:hypothetical protein